MEEVFMIDKSKYKKSHIISMFLLLLTYSNVNNVFADVSSDLGNFFTSLGYDGNLTPTSAYHGQAAGYYSGGGVFLRNQVKNLQVFHIDLPEYKSGCGGIDLFGGGFSFVNATELTAFFQKIMSNAAGYMFTLALETAVPEIAHNMEFIQKMAQEINSSNFNSCEMAETLVGGMWPKVKTTQQHICRDLGHSKNAFSDWAQARQKCSEKDVYSEKIKSAADDENYQKMVMNDKNLIWAAISKNTFLAKDNKLAEFFMSLSGTIVYDSNGKATIYNSLAKDRGVIKALLEGGMAKVYVCNEYSKCLAPKLTEIAISKDNALYEKVKNTINELVSALSNASTDSQGLDSKLIGFLEFTRLPILKFINAHLMSGNPSMAMSITSYSQAIAKSLLMQYMHEALQLVENSLSGTDYSPEIHKQLTDQIHQAIGYIENIRTESQQDLRELMMFIDSSKKVEREVTAKVTGQIKMRK